MAFENKSGAALSGIKARFYSSTSNSPIATVDVGTGTIADGDYATFTIPENYGSYVQFVTADGTILGDPFSNFLGEGVGESNVESFVYNSTTKYCYKYKNSASDSTWGVPGDGVKIYNAADLETFLTGDGVVGILDASFDCSTPITVKGDKTLNLNGKTITSNADSLFTVGSGATLTITDNVVVTDNKTTATVDKYGNKGSMTNYALTYYVTESTASETATTETPYQHTVDFGSAGKIVSSSTGDNVINVTGGTLNLEGGVISSNGSHAVVLDTTNGGNMNMSGGLIKGKNDTADGAGIYMGSGNLNMSGGYIAGGASNKGGGIYMNSGTINLTDDAVIAANKATTKATTNGAGGGIYVNSGVLNLHGGTVASNWVDSGDDSNGGGIYVKSGTISMTDGYVTNNSQYGGRNDAYGQNGGGGIAFDAAQMYMSGGYITGNHADEAGGGVYAGFWHANDVGARFVMSGGTVASNYAKNGEGGGIRISGGTEGVVSGPSGSTVYITNNTTMTTKDWGGGGIMVQTEGTFNIMDVLITNNHAEGFGGGVASCPTGDVDAVYDKGAAIFGNKADCSVVRPAGGVKNYDVAFKESYLQDGRQFNSKTDVRDYFCTNQSKANEEMLGGGKENWTGPRKSPGDEGMTNMPWRIVDDGDIHFVMALTANPTDADKNAAKAAASVIISGNWSHTHGGGITTNGTLDMGKTTRTENGTSLTISATKQVMKAAGGVQTTDLPPFEFVLLNKKPTWNPATKQFDYAEDTKVLQTKTNGGDGDISFDAIDYKIAAAAYYTYYLIENPTTTVKGTYEQDPTLYTIGVMVKSTTTTIDTTKTTTYTIEKVELKLEQNGVSIGSKAGNLVDLGNNEKSITLTDLNGKTTFNNKEVDHYSLPETGGPGTSMIYLLGIALIVLAGGGYILRNRRLLVTRPGSGHGRKGGDPMG